jgi:hypothetical protein
MAQLAFDAGDLVLELDPKSVFNAGHKAGQTLPVNTTNDTAAIMAAVRIAVAADEAAAVAAAAKAAVILPVPVTLLSDIMQFESGPLKVAVANLEKAFGISGVTFSVDWEDTYNKLKPSDRSNLVVMVAQYTRELCGHSVGAYLVKDNVIRCSILLSWTSRRLLFRMVPDAQFSMAQLAFDAGDLVLELDPKSVFNAGHKAGQTLPVNTTNDTAAIMAAVRALSL